MAGAVRIAQPSPADVAAVRLLAPLAVDLMIRCGPFHVPAAVAASAATLEQESSEEAQVTRDFVKQDPYHGMGSVYPGGWMFLARDDDTVVIGRREGRVGLGAVVQLERRNGAFEAAVMGGWELQMPDAAERVEACFTAHVEDTTVTLHWTNDQGLDGAPRRVNPRVELLEGPDDVHFLLHTASAEPRPAEDSWISGTGGPDATSFELTTPLRDRRLLSDHGIPPDVVTLLPGGHGRRRARRRRT